MNCRSPPAPAPKSLGGASAFTPRAITLAFPLRRVWRCQSLVDASLPWAPPRHDHGGLVGIGNSCGKRRTLMPGRLKQSRADAPVRPPPPPRSSRQMKPVPADVEMKRLPKGRWCERWRRRRADGRRCGGLGRVWTCRGVEGGRLSEAESKMLGSWIPKLSFGSGPSGFSGLAAPGSVVPGFSGKT